MAFWFISWTASYLPPPVNRAELKLTGKLRVTIYLPKHIDSVSLVKLRYLFPPSLYWTSITSALMPINLAIQNKDIDTNLGRLLIIFKCILLQPPIDDSAVLPSESSFLDFNSYIHQDYLKLRLWAYAERTHTYKHPFICTDFIYLLHDKINITLGTIRISQQQAAKLC